MSDDWAAALPSLPAIPTPNVAEVSIDTSFAPSPIANTFPDIAVTIFLLFLGVHRAKTKNFLF